MQSRSSKIVKALGNVSIVQSLCGLQLNEHQSFDEQIERKVSDDRIFVSRHNALLLRNHEPNSSKFQRKRILIDPFDKADTQRIADLIGAANDGLRELI